MRNHFYALRTLSCLAASVVILLGFADRCYGRSDAHDGPRWLYVHEPTRVGVTKDSDDVGYLDFQMSFRFSSPEVDKVLQKGGYFSPNSLHVAFTTRLGQYIGTRESSPVIGKRFNPEMFFRWGGWEHSYIDFGYAHESNGQSIVAEKQFDAAVGQQIRINENPRFARDQLSRGWDYFEATVAYKEQADSAGGWAAYVTARHFLDDGLLQGEAEEVKDFERPTDVQHRREVHGLRGLFRWHLAKVWGPFDGFKVVAIYVTGIGRPLAHSSVRFEFGTLRVLPIIVWFSDGYLSDLAQFNKRVTSWGVAVEFKPFSRQSWRNPER